MPVKEDMHEVPEPAVVKPTGIRMPRLAKKQKVEMKAELPEPSSLLAASATSLPAAGLAATKVSALAALASASSSGLEALDGVSSAEPVQCVPLPATPPVTAALAAAPDSTAKSKKPCTHANSLDAVAANSTAKSKKSCTHANSLESALETLLKKHDASFKHANWMARELLKQGFAKDCIEAAIVAFDLTVYGNWSGKRDADTTVGENPNACKWCEHEWNPAKGVKRRGQCALHCSSCDTAGRALGARSERTIWQLSEENWAKFLELSEAARERSAQRSQRQRAESLVAASRRRPRGAGSR